MDIKFAFVFLTVHHWSWLLQFNIKRRTCPGILKAAYFCLEHQILHILAVVVSQVLNYLSGGWIVVFKKHNWWFGNLGFINNFGFHFAVYVNWGPCVDKLFLVLRPLNTLLRSYNLSLQMAIGDRRYHTLSSWSYAMMLVVWYLLNNGLRYTKSFALLSNYRFSSFLTCRLLLLLFLGFIKSLNALFHPHFENVCFNLFIICPVVIIPKLFGFGFLV
jgi:hypothetical protein